MFYLSIKLRDRNKPTPTKGPDFRKATPLKINISGNIISLNAPKDSAGATPAHVRKEAQSYYDFPESPDNEPFKEKHYAELTDAERKQQDLYNMHRPPQLRIRDNGAPGWNIEVLTGRAWDFYGPWFTGVLATVHMGITISRESKSRQGSYFNPRVLEIALLDNLAEGYSMHNQAQYWSVPEEWEPLNCGVGPAVSYISRIQDKPMVSPDYEDEYEVAFPINDSTLVFIHFEFRRKHRRTADNSTVEDIEKWTSSEPMRYLIKQIIDSVEVKLSPESQAQLERAQAGLEDTSLTKDFAPIDIEAYLKHKAEMTEAEAAKQQANAATTEKEIQPENLNSIEHGSDKF